MIWLWLFLIILHILCCVFTFIGFETGFLRVHRYMFPVVVFLPLWGILAVLVLHTEVFLKTDGKKKIGVEKLRLDSEIYKGVVVEENKIASSVVPMEEALIINNARERRELIMDILNDNPKEYIEFLQKAGDNDDTEVVHYAVTAMVEISKENDYILQKLERKYSQNKENLAVIGEYADFLWSCLEQNLMQGQVEFVNRNLFSELTAKKLAAKPDKEDYAKIIRNYLALKNYSSAGVYIAEMSEHFPECEELVLTKLSYYAAIGRGDEIKQLMDEIDREHIYLSAGAKEAVAFWRN